MTSILFLINTDYCIIIRWNYSRNKRHYRNFFFHLGNLDSILKNFQKKMTLIADVFFNLGTPKTVIR